MMKRLAIVGRPNVGKSTLFNRLVGKQLAIVYDTPGVTRDWKENPARLGDLEFLAVDTAGIEKAVKGDVILTGMKEQTEKLLQKVDAVLFVVDGRTGLTEADKTIGLILRKLDVPVVLVANKCEGRQDLSDIYGLGLGEPIPISAAHGTGLADLYDALQPHLSQPDDDRGDGVSDAMQEIESVEAIEARAAASSDDDAPVLTSRRPDKPIHLALVGRPNVGKSTLLNAFLGEERVLVSPIAGTTRDTISSDWQWNDQRFRLVDTAGLRRKARIDEKLEKMATAETLRVVRLAEIVVLVLDANIALEQQDLTIADLVLREGRALVIALNKWDTVKEQAALLREIRFRLDESLQQAKGIAVVPISALKGRKLDQLLAAVIDTYDVWDKRVSTGQLNRWLDVMVESHAPPLVDGRRIKIRYMTQRKGRPPTFVLFCGTHAKPPESYLRYLTNGLRERFDFPGVPIRFEIKRSKNPYADDKKEG